MFADFFKLFSHPITFYFMVEPTALRKALRKSPLAG
jgi:hypothetical protein